MPHNNDLAIAKLRVKYSATNLSTTAAHGDYMAKWRADHPTALSIDSTRTVIKAALDLIPVSYPALVATDDLWKLYWTNVTL